MRQTASCMTSAVATDDFAAVQHLSLEMPRRSMHMGIIEMAGKGLA
ncbi:MAG: hypothetical protein JJT81_13900 [Rubellimicrobium sp.]|nr:hypothetical protein [Rubellimicrobium sp.]